MNRATGSVELPDGVRIPYVEQGDASGTAVVFLHGFAGSRRSFEPVLKRLPDTVRACALTQRGHGDAGRPDTGYGVVQLAADLEAFLDALGLDEAVVVGHSMGSAVALRFAIDRPGRTAGLVLVGAAPSLRPTPAARTFWESALSTLSDPVDLELIRGTIESSVARPLPRRLRDTLVREASKVPARVWKAAIRSRLRLEGEFEAELGAVAAPTLLVWGERDARYSRAEQDALLEAIPGARLLAYPGVGHSPHLEAPERFAGDLLGFLAEMAGDVAAPTED
ncbi:MAG: alpha/beta fold hydrolase [Gemmatimonadota bacterium]